MAPFQNLPALRAVCKSGVWLGVNHCAAGCESYCVNVKHGRALIWRWRCATRCAARPCPCHGMRSAGTRGCVFGRLARVRLK